MSANLVSVLVATPGDTVDLHTVPLGVFVLIGNIIYKIIKKDNLKRPILQVEGKLKGALDLPIGYTVTIDPVAVDKPYPVTYLGDPLSAALLLKMDHGRE